MKVYATPSLQRNGLEQRLNQLRVQWWVVRLGDEMLYQQNGTGIQQELPLDIVKHRQHVGYGKIQKAQDGQSTPSHVPP